jgi:iron(III) transport system permease protein
MSLMARPAGWSLPKIHRFRPGTGAFVMAILLPLLGFYLVWPVVFVFAQSFNVGVHVFAERQWGLDNWMRAWSNPLILPSIRNSFVIWGATAAISFPVSIAIAWALARIKMPFSYPLEYLFWVAYMIPGGSIAWILLLEPGGGFVNVFLRGLPFMQPFIDELGRGPFNIYSVPGIIWAHLMGNGIALKVMILTPAFRNMDATLEEAARVSGATNLRTMLRITLPLMISPIVLVLALQLLRIFQSFETEFLLGRPINFWVYSTVIYDQVRSDPPAYGVATTLATLTLLVILFIVPLQRWIISRRQYTTISGTFKPGLIDIGKWKWAVLGAILGLHVLLTFVQVGAFVLGSFMTRAGWFNIPNVFTLRHWQLVYSDPQFLQSLQTTLVLASTAALVGPILFSMLAYIIVRTKWPGRAVMDWMIWISAAVPGMLSGLGLLMVFLGTPGLAVLYGTIWALLLVVVMQGNTTGVNLSKAAFLQIGNDMEEAARVAGAGWIRTYFRIWLPLLMPLLILLGVLNFVSAASATASVILLASQETMTLSILALRMATHDVGRIEAASVVTLHISMLTLGVAMIARRFGLNLGIRHN